MRKITLLAAILVATAPLAACGSAEPQQTATAAARADTVTVVCIDATTKAAVPCPSFGQVTAPVAAPLAAPVAAPVTAPVAAPLADTTTPVVTPVAGTQYTAPAPGTVRTVQEALTDLLNRQIIEVRLACTGQEGCHDGNRMRCTIGRGEGQTLLARFGSTLLGLGTDGSASLNAMRRYEAIWKQGEGGSFVLDWNATQQSVATLRAYPAGTPVCQ